VPEDSKGHKFVCEGLCKKVDSIIDNVFSKFKSEENSLIKKSKIFNYRTDVYLKTGLVSKLKLCELGHPKRNILNFIPYSFNINARAYTELGLEICEEFRKQYEREQFGNVAIFQQFGSISDYSKNNK